jgi:hypothetical protein
MPLRLCYLFRVFRAEHWEIRRRKDRRSPDNLFNHDKTQASRHRRLFMGAEFAAAMGDSSYYTFDHDVTRVVAGDAESLRARLADALEQMGYRVLNETPIQARRSAAASAKSGCSPDILDYGRSLDIGLKSAGTNATRVTFAYTVKGVHSGYLTKGDRNTLTREAEAAIALAMSRAALSHCPACGASASGARFCRQCGAPVAADDPPELELLRLTAGANASYKSIIMGAICTLVGLLLPTLIYLFKHDTMSAGKLLKLITLLVSFISGPGLVFVLMGLWRLAGTIKRKPEQDELHAPSRRGVEGAPDTAALPPQSIQYPVQHSITEATTGLLPQEVKRTNDLN